MTTIRLLTFLSVAMLVSSCGSQLDPALSAGPQEQSNPNTAAAKQPTGSNYDPGQSGEFEKLAQTHPGFAGLIIGKDGNVDVYGTNQTVFTTIKNDLAPQLQAKIQDRSESKAYQMQGLSLPKKLKFTFHKVKYDYQQLMDFKRVMRANIFNVEGVNRLSITVAENGLTVGTDLRTQHGKVISAAAKLKIPPDALKVSEQRRVQRVALRGTLRDVQDTYVAGLTLFTARSTFCTLGFNAYLRTATVSRKGFATATHCSTSDANLDNSAYRQGTSSAAPTIGTEVFDPRPFNSTVDGNCPIGDTCRWSELSFVQYNASAAPKAQMATILTTQYKSTGVAGSIDIVGSTSFDESSTYINDPIEKIGAATGWTYGTVTEACVDFRPEETTNKAYVMLCQNIADLYIGSGDSGSATFADYGFGPGLNGLLWGALDPVPGQVGLFTTAIYSDLWNVRQDANLQNYSLELY